MLAAHRHVADLIRRAGIEHGDAALAEIALRLFLPLHRLLRHAGDVGVLRVDAVDELAGIDLGLRGLDHHVAIEVELGEHRIHALLGEGLHGRRAGVPGAGDVLHVHQPLGAERLAVAHQEVHRLLLGQTLLAVEHGLFGVGELHGDNPITKKRAR